MIDSDSSCRICLLELSDSRPFFQLSCDCKGEISFSHVECAERWFSIKGSNVCEICGKTVKNIILLANSSEHSQADARSAQSRNVFLEEREGDYHLDEGYNEDSSHEGSWIRVEESESIENVERSIASSDSEGGGWIVERDYSPRNRISFPRHSASMQHDHMVENEVGSSENERENEDGIMERLGEIRTNAGAMNVGLPESRGQVLARVYDNNDAHESDNDDISDDNTQDRVDNFHNVSSSASAVHNRGSQIYADIITIRDGNDNNYDDDDDDDDGDDDDESYSFDHVRDIENYSENGSEYEGVFNSVNHGNDSNYRADSDVNTYNHGIVDGHHSHDDDDDDDDSDFNSDNDGSNYSSFSFIHHLANVSLNDVEEDSDSDSSTDDNENDESDDSDSNYEIYDSEDDSSNESSDNTDGSNSVSDDAIENRILFSDVDSISYSEGSIFDGNDSNDDDDDNDGDDDDNDDANSNDTHYDLMNPIFGRSNAGTVVGVGTEHNDSEYDDVDDHDVEHGDGVSIVVDDGGNDANYHDNNDDDGSGYLRHDQYDYGRVNGGTSNNYIDLANKEYCDDDKYEYDSVSACDDGFVDYASDDDGDFDYDDGDGFVDPYDDGDDYSF